MPRQFAQLGDRLVYSNGIIFLAVMSSLLLVIFQGTVHFLIPLYAVGVFLSFSLSQAGMMKRHLTLKQPGWQKSVMINGFGFTMSSIVLVMTLVTKFVHGAWVIILLIVLLNFAFKAIRHHYETVAKDLKMREYNPSFSQKHLFVVLVPYFNKAVAEAIEYAKSLNQEVIAVHINISKRGYQTIVNEWKKFHPGIPLKIIESPYRALVQPLLKYLTELEKTDKNLMITVVITEFIPKKWWQHLLHNQTALSLKTAIHFRKRTNYISLQYHLHR